MRGRGLLRAAAVVFVALGAACAPAPRSERAPVGVELRPFLPDPAAALGTPAAAPWAALHARLLAGETAGTVAADIDRAASADPAAAHLLRAELALVGNDGATAFREVEQLPAVTRLRPAVRLIEARAREVAGDSVEAFAIYRDLETSSPAAAGRAAELESQAVRAVRERIDEALQRGRPGDARRDLERLRAWRPRDVATLTAAAQLASALEDPVAELAALRALATAGALDEERSERRARLELEVGEPEVALGELERLAARHPGDARLAEDLDRARFRWRLGHAPEAVQDLAHAASLTRAQLARLLYWLVPGVRAGRGGVARIASDVVGHEAQEEIVRVVNLGLMSVDESLHRFEPDRPARRIEALGAVLRAAAVDGGVPACGGAALAASWSRESVCAAATACALVASDADCLPGGALSGREALDWVRRALSAAEAPR